MCLHQVEKINICTGALGLVPGSVADCSGAVSVTGKQDEYELTDVLRCKCSALLQIMELRKPSHFTQRGKFCFYEQQYIGLWALRIQTETIQL